MIVEKSTSNGSPAPSGRHDDVNVGVTKIHLFDGHFGCAMWVVMSPLRGSFFVGYPPCHNHIAPLGLVASKPQRGGMIVEQPISHPSPAPWGRHDEVDAGFTQICSFDGHFGFMLWVVMSPLQGSHFVGYSTCYNHIAPLGLAVSKPRGRHDCRIVRNPPHCSIKLPRWGWWYQSPMGAA